VDPPPGGRLQLDPIGGALAGPVSGAEPLPDHAFDARPLDLGDGRLVAEVSVDGPVTSAVGDQVTVVAAGSRLVLLDTRTGAVTGDAVLPSPVVGADANRDGSAVVTVEQPAPAAAVLRVWRRQPDGTLGAGDPVTVDLGADTLRQVVVAADGGRLLVVTDRRAVLVPSAGGAPAVVDDGGGDLVARDPSGRFVAVGGPRLAVWDLHTGQRPIALPERVSAMAWGGTCMPGESCVLTTVRAPRRQPPLRPSTGRREAGSVHQVRTSPALRPSRDRSVAQYGSGGATDLGPRRSIPGQVSWRDDRSGRRSQQPSSASP